MDKVKSFKLKASTWLQGYGGGHQSTTNRSSTTAENALSDEDLALRRLDETLENRKYVQLVSYIHDIADETLTEILESLPYRNLVKGMPETIVAVDALFSRIDRLKSASNSKVEFPKSVCDELAVQMSVLLEMGENEPDMFAQEIHVSRQTLTVIIRHYPELRAKLDTRCKQMTLLVDSLAQHVRIGAEAHAPTLKEAIVEEVNKTLKDLKTSSDKLESFSVGDKINRPGSSRSLGRRKTNKSSSSSSSSLSVESGEEAPQDDMAVSQRHIQDRLIRNQTLMSMVKPVNRRGNLPALIDMLDERLRNDKDVLAMMSQIKAEVEYMGVSMDEPVGPVILRHVHAFGLLLRLWDECQADIVRQEQMEREDAEAEMTVLAMGASDGISSTSMATIEEHANGEISQNGDNFLSSSQKSEILSVVIGHRHVSRTSSEASSAHLSQGLRSVFFDLAQQGQLSLPPSVAGSVQASPSMSRGGSRASSFRRRDGSASADEFERQRQELLFAYEKINQLKKREKELTDRLSEQAQRQLEASSKFEDVSLGLRPTQLIKQYEELYSQQRVDALDGLDDIDIDLSEDGVDEASWKSHLLFTVLKMSFSYAASAVREVKERVRSLLHAPSLDSKAQNIRTAAAKQLDAACLSYLRRSAVDFTTGDISENVANDLWLHYADKPILQSCFQLREFISACSQLAWEMKIQSPPMSVSHHAQYFTVDYHSRFYSANTKSDEIISYLWPTLLDCEGGSPVSKAVVMT